MKKILFITLIILSLVFLFSVNKQEDALPSSHMVLNYKEFGTPALSFELLGQAWWQWYSYYGVLGAKFDIKVVVYTKDVSLAEIKKRYPVIKEKNQDYRYVSYEKVMQYLKKIETEDKEYFNGCRADSRCHELDFYDRLREQLKVLNVSHCIQDLLPEE